MISVKAYHNKEQNRRLRQLFSGKWAIQVRNPGMSRGCQEGEEIKIRIRIKIKRGTQGGETTHKVTEADPPCISRAWRLLLAHVHSGL